MKNYFRLLLASAAFIIFCGCAHTAAEWSNIGLAAYKAGNYDDAIKDYSKAIELDPKYSIAFFNRGHALSKIENYEQAIVDYTKAIELDTKFTVAYNNRGYSYRKMGNYQQAIKDFNKAIELNPDYVISYYNRGVAYRILENYNQAIVEFSKAIELNQQYAWAHNDLAWLYATAKSIKHRDGNLAIKYAQRALQLEKENPSFTDTLAAAYAEAGRFDEAIAKQEEAITIFRANGKKDLSRYIKRLELYKEHKAWTE
jgi:tetratricopeptide (TPR) repeat protein